MHYWDSRAVFSASGRFQLCGSLKDQLIAMTRSLEILKPQCTWSFNSEQAEVFCLLNIEKHLSNTELS
jgi:hypothetical protein